MDTFYKCSIVYCICRCTCRNVLGTRFIVTGTDLIVVVAPFSYVDSLTNRLLSYNRRRWYTLYIHCNTAVTSTGGCKVCVMGSGGTPHTPYCSTCGRVSHSVTLTRDTLASTRHRSTAFVSDNRPAAYLQYLLDVCISYTTPRPPPVSGTTPSFINKQHSLAAAAALHFSLSKLCIMYSQYE